MPQAKKELKWKNITQAEYNEMYAAECALNRPLQMESITAAHGYTNMIIHNEVLIVVPDPIQGKKSFPLHSTKNRAKFKAWVEAEVQAWRQVMNENMKVS